MREKFCKNELKPFRTLKGTLLCIWLPKKVDCLHFILCIPFLCPGNDFLKVIVDHGGGEDANTQNNLGRTPLHEVAQLGDEKMLKIMWKLNANANIIDQAFFFLSDFEGNNFAQLRRRRLRCTSLPSGDTPRWWRL